MGRPARITTEQVMQAARDAFSVAGYHATTLADIARRLGVTPAALLRHAPTKEALFARALGRGGADEPLPMEFLAAVDADADPRPVLRRLAHAFVPFVESKMAESIARWMHARTPAEARTLTLPFDPRVRPTPPQRGLAMVEAYMRRAARAGRLRLRDPRAAAFVFMGSLHSYVFLHRVLRVMDPPLPLDRYVDTILDLWTRGAIRQRAARGAGARGARRRRTAAPMRAAVRRYGSQHGGRS
jgi:AcrR family transcriptional regulator